MKTLFLILFAFCFSLPLLSQEQDSLLINNSSSQEQLDSIQKIKDALEYKKSHTDFYVLRRGRLFGSWGYNRSTYGRSTIRFWGDGYDFKIIKAVAKDRQTKFDPKVYFNPSLVTIPQYNLRIGYYFTNHLSLTLNVDHMKYVLDNSQVAAVDGYVDSSASQEWAGTYDSKKLMKLSSEFIGYEHTDGLNVVSLELDYNDLFYETYNRRFAVDLIAGVGLGATIPKTNAVLFNKFGNDAFHLSGGGITANVGLKLFFFKHFFLHPTAKTGLLFMPNVATNGLENDRASQNISFFQWNFTVGYQIKIAHK